MTTKTAHPIRTSARPRLVPKARLQADRVRGGQVLLYPEGVLLLSPTAAGALALCDGQRDVAGVIAELAKQYDAPAGQIATDVIELLTQLRNRGLVDLTSCEAGGDA
jgi:pyrroloquinoline quinone biosynthesis protein D